MSRLQHRRSNNDVVVVVKRRPKPVSTQKAMPKKESFSKPLREVKAKVSKPSEKKKPVAKSKSVQVKNDKPKSYQTPKKKYTRVDPKIYFAITPKINALLPEPPFKLGISDEIFKKLVGSCGVSNKLLRRIINKHFRYITSGKNYLKIFVKASHRHGLDGSKTEISEEHRKSAAVRLEYIRARQKRSLSKVGKSNPKSETPPA